MIAPLDTVPLDLVHTADQEFLRSGDGRWFPAPEGLQTSDNESLRTRLMDEARALQHKRAQWLDGYLVRFLRGADVEHGAASEWVDGLVEAATPLFTRHGASVARGALTDGSDTHENTVTFGIGGSADQRCEFTTSGAFTHVYREGDVVFVEPMRGINTPYAPTSQQIQRRRLAASLVPQALKASWHGIEPLGSISVIEPAELQRIATRLVHVSHGYLNALGQDSAPSSSHVTSSYELWRLDTVSSVSSTHMTLPYPAPAPR